MVAGWVDSSHHLTVQDCHHLFVAPEDVVDELLVEGLAQEADVPRVPIGQRVVRG